MWDYRPVTLPMHHFATMPWKLILLSGVFCAGLYIAGYRPGDVKNAADSLGRANAEGVSPTRSDNGGWGSLG